MTWPNSSSSMTGSVVSKNMMGSFDGRENLLLPIFVRAQATMKK
jgi:hypothetical protein